MKKILLFLLLTVCIGWGCTQKAPPPKSPVGYDLNKPGKFIMPESLLEISGICFYKSNPDTVYAIQDEEGKVFRLAWGTKRQDHAKFARSGDYEDVSILKDRLYVLHSNGSIYSFAFSDAVYVEVDDVKEWKQVLPKGEYEAMYGDEASGNLYVLCKNCKADEDKDVLTGYIISLPGGTPLVNSFSINTKSISQFTGKVKKGFRPSALAKNPLTNEWFIVSAVNKILVVADANWNIKSAYPLSGNIFNQPEGLAFDKDGNMYISNEGDDLAAGNILKFERKDASSKLP